MYRVQWRFPPFASAKGPLAGRPERGWKPREGETGYPFFPLPYRTKRGGILFPCEGHAWVKRDDFLSALAWAKAYDFKSWEYELIIYEAWKFEEKDATVRPFEFIRELYDMRRALKDKEEAGGAYDIQELAIKLSLNSIYGKFAQRIGGSEFEPPATVCPYYASAITAATRRRMVEAALVDPDAIVMFATDGIVSTRTLERDGKVAGRAISERLGDWETKRVIGGMFLQSGFYTFLDAATGKPETKLRGARKAHILMPGHNGGTMHDFLIEGALKAWRAPRPLDDFKAGRGQPHLDIEQNCVSACKIDPLTRGIGVQN